MKRWNGGRSARVAVLRALTVCLVIAAPAAAASSASHPDVTITASTTDLVYGKAVALSGRAPASESVALQVQRFPFKKKFRTVATARANASGDYSFSQKPTHAIHYRVQVKSHGKELSTPSVTVYVEVRSITDSCNLCTADTPGKHTLIITGAVQAPSGYLDIHGPEYFYYGLLRGTVEPAKIPLVQKVKLQVGRYHRISFTVRYTVDFPKSAFMFAFADCFKDNESKDGIGRPGRHPCGNRTLSRSQYRGYLG